MAEAWKESLKRIKRGEERERELSREKDANSPGAHKEPHMPMIALEPTIRNLGTVIRDAAKLYATLLEATNRKHEASAIRRDPVRLFVDLRYNEEE